MNSSLKNAALMLAPCLLLVGVGVLLKNRKPAVLTVVQTGPFKVFVRGVHVLTPEPSEVQDGYDTKLEVELDSTGKAPLWWQQGMNASFGTKGGQLVVQGEKGATRVGDVPYCRKPRLDSASKKWISTYLLKLAPIDGKAGDIHLRDSIQIVNNVNIGISPPVWLDYKVRAKGVTTKIPNVSRDPHLKLVRWKFDEAPPVENNGISCLRLRLWFDKQGSQKETESYSVATALNIVDVSGKTSTPSGIRFSGDDRPDEIGYQGIASPYVTKPQRTYEAQAFNLPLGAKHPLCMQGEVTFKKNWPLWLNIPLTDASGKIQFSPRPKPAFKLGATTIRKATARDKALYSCDTVVTFDMLPLNPKQDVSTWHWNGYYSQHIVPAKGPTMWTFPSKTGKQPINVAYKAIPSLMHVSYFLNLVAIPASVGTLTLVAGISGNNSTYLPVSVVVRSATPKAGATPTVPGKAIPLATATIAP